MTVEAGTESQPLDETASQRSRPGKIVAVHLNYSSRAAQRGRIPAHPSYFVKPITTLAASGDVVVRPPGCELLAFEGEIALIIGRAGKGLSVDEAWSHVSAVTAANDFGVYDLRHADGGSNLRSKGIDGYTPIGPKHLDAAAIDPMRLRLRTWVDGELVQDAHTSDELIFSFAALVADLSRLMTLEPGDIILTGTPAGSSVVQPGQRVEVEVSTDDGRLSTGRLVSPIEQAPDDAPMPIGVEPKVDDALRALATGSAAPATDAPDTDVAELLERLGRSSTATLSSQLRKRGLDGCTLDGLVSARPDLRLAGVARTVQYLPGREDLFQRFGGGFNAQKRAIEQLGPGEVLVISARGETTAGTIGDILALRAQLRGAAGIITDGAVRDAQSFAGLDIPTYHAGAHPAVLGRRHVPWTTDVAVACGGVLIEPGDLLIGDADGVLVVPRAVAAEVADGAIEQELEERYIAERVAAGDGIEGLYPLGAEQRARYEQWRASRPT